MPFRDYGREATNEILTSNPSDSGLRSIPRLLGENASCDKLFIRVCAFVIVKTGAYGKRAV